MGKLFEDHDVEPLNDFIFVKKRSDKEMTEGGIYIPSTSQDESLLADVLAAGPGRIHEDGERHMTIKAGDIVLVDRIGGIPLEVGGEKLYVMREAEIMAVVRSKK